MSKRKNKPLPPWASANLDGKEGRFIQVGNSLLLSKKYHELKPGAQQLYLFMMDEAGGHARFKFPASSMEKYGIEPRTGWRLVRKLENKGFIRKVYCGRSQMNPNEYEFISDWKQDREKAL